MNIERVNAWLGFCGNIAILAGLIALAIEINDNTAAVRAQELGALREQDQARQLATLDSDFGDLYFKSLNSPNELTPSEVIRLVSFVSQWIGNLERTYWAYSDGIVREADWNRKRNGAPIFLGTPFGKVLWEEIKGDFADSPEFVSAVDIALRTSPVVPDDKWYSSLMDRVRAMEP